MKKLNCHPYSFDIWFTTDQEKFWLKRQHLTGWGNRPNALGMCSMDDNGGRQVVGLFNGDPSVLVHELSHAVINGFTFLGMPVNQDTTEAFAYLIESLNRQCLKHMALSAK